LKRREADLKRSEDHQKETEASARMRERAADFRSRYNPTTPAATEPTTPGVEDYATAALRRTQEAMRAAAASVKSATMGERNAAAKEPTEAEKRRAELQEAERKRMADLQERMASFRTGARPSSNAPFNTNAYGRPHSAAPGGSNTAVGAEEARRKEQLERLRKLNDMASKAKSDAAKAADDTAKHMRDAEARAETVRKQWEAHRAGVAGGARPGTAPSGGAGPASYDGSKFQSAGRSGYEPTGQQQQRQNWEEAFKQRQAQYGCVYMPCPPRSRPDYNPRSAAPRQTESTAIHFRIVSKLAVRLYMYR